MVSSPLNLVNLPRMESKKSDMKTKRTLTLSETLDKQLRVYAAEKRIPVGEVVENAVQFYLAYKSTDVTTAVKTS